MDRPGPTLRSARAWFVVIVVVQLAFVAYAAWVYWPREEAVESRIVLATGDGAGGTGAEPGDGPGGAEPGARPGGAGAGTVQGIVEMRLSSGSVATWTVEASDGRVVQLGQGATATWDTRDGPNGAYTVVAQAGGTTSKRAVDVQNPRTDVATATAVVATTTAVAAGGSALASSVASRLTVAAVQVGKETALALGEDHLRLRTAGRRRHMPGAVALVLTLVLVFLLFALEGLDRLGWQAYLAALPVAGGVSAAFVALALGVEALLAWAGRARSRVRFLGSGAVSLAISSIVFRTPFGYPGFVEEEDDADADGSADQPAHVEAARAAASLLVLVGLLQPFLWLGAHIDARIGEQATEIALVTLATGALPIRPMPGYDIWRWRKLPAAVLALVAYTLFFGFVLAFLVPWWLVAIGWTGLAFYAVTFAWLRARTARPPPPAYVAIRTAWADLLAGASTLSPRSWHRLAAAATRAASRIGHTVDAAARRVAAAMQHAWAPVARRLAARQQRRADAAVAEARRRFIQDAQEFLRGLEDLPDDTIVSGESVYVRLGDMRLDLLRQQLATALGAEPPRFVTVGPHVVQMDP